MKGLRVITIVKKIKFVGVWVELKLKKDFQRQSFTRYLRLTLVFMWNAVLREMFNFCKGFLMVLAKLLFWPGDWALGYYSMEFRHFLDISWFPKMLSLKSSATWVYHVYLSNNRASFHLWWKHNFVKHQKVSKYKLNFRKKVWNMLKDNNEMNFHNLKCTPPPSIFVGIEG